MSNTATQPATAEMLRQFAEVLNMLEQRERTAQAAYDEIRDRLDAEDRTAREGGVPAMSADEYEQERAELRRASARWTEAQESLGQARAILAR